MSTRRKLTFLGGALVLSMALNIFLVGAFGGRLAFAGSEAPLATPPTRPIMAARFQALPEAERSRFRETMLQHSAAMRDAQRDLRAAQFRALAALRSAPFDKSAMQAAFAGLRVTVAARQEAVQTGLLEALATLSPASRASLATGTSLTQP